MNHLITTIADVRVRLNFTCEGTAEFFPAGEADDAYDVAVSVSREQIEQYRSFYEDGSSDAYIEALELCQNAANALLPFGATCFHGSAFLWQGKAWIFTGPSGTGKTTQYVLWKSLFGDEITMICGDKPFLKVNEAGKVWVHSSPWRGKENMGNDISAELGGIIYLAKDPENTLLPLAAKDAMLPLFMQFLSRKENESFTDGILAIENAVLQQAPVYLFRNNGTEEAARLCHDALLGEKKS